MSLQKSEFCRSIRFPLWEIFGRSYDPCMYENTVHSDNAEEPTLVRVRSAREADRQMEGCLRDLTSQGVRALIFPNDELLKTWRTRLAALA